MAQPSDLLNTLLIDAGTPPKDWLKISSSAACTAIILSLWESTISLIENEWFLGKDQERFLAMVRDHKREFDGLFYLTSGELIEIPETKYLHSKLETGPQPVPTFDRTKFRSLVDRKSPWNDLPKINEKVDELLLDPELKIIVEHILRLRLVISELEVAKKVIREASIGGLGKTSSRAEYSLW